MLFLLFLFRIISHHALGIANRKINVAVESELVNIKTATGECAGVLLQVQLTTLHNSL